MAIPLRGDFDALGLRAAARRSKGSGQARRLLALAAVDDGATRTEAARHDQNGISTALAPDVWAT
jgi:hypothetical protein